MTYTKTIWKNLPDTTTPINATNLNNMENGIEEAVNNRLPLTGGTITGNMTFNAALFTKGSVEVYNTTPFIDFHFNNDNTVDYTSRIVEMESGKLQIISNNGFEITCSPANFKINNTSLDTVCIKNGNTANKITLSWATTQLKLTVDNTDIGYFAMAGSSDRRLKEDIKQIDDDVINAISEVKLKQFRLKRNNPNHQISFGVIAQELIEAFEKYNLDIEDYSLISTIVYEDGIEYYIVDYNQFNVLKLAALEKKTIVN